MEHQSLAAADSISIVLRYYSLRRWILCVQRRSVFGGFGLHIAIRYQVIITFMLHFAL